MVRVECHGRWHTAAVDGGGQVFVGDSDMAARMAAFDWSASTLGPVENWPESLRAAVGICLDSRYPMVIWWGPELALLYNDALVPLLGPAKHPALAKPGAQVWPEMWHIIGRQLHSVLATGEATFSDNQLLPADRFGFLEEAYFTYSYSAIRDHRGQVGGVFTAASETTAQVLTERRLRTLRALGEITGSVGSPGDTTLRDICSAALRALDADRADIPFAAVYVRDPSESAATLAAHTGLSSTSALPAASTEFSPLQQALSAKESRVIDGLPERWRRAVLGGANPVGDRVPHTAMALPIQVGEPDLPDALLVAGVSPYRSLDDDMRAFLDLTAAQIGRAVNGYQAYQAQRRRAEALAELDRTRSVFFANVSHEFRTPLTLITAPAEEALNDTDEPLTTAHRKRLETIHRNAGRLGRLVDDMLDFARIEAGKYELEPCPTDLSALTAELAESFAAAIARAGLALHTAIDPDLHTANVDPRMWEKVVLNLVSNALKYTLEGSIQVSLHRVDNALSLAVHDTGIGVAPHEAPRLFERFHRVRSRTGRSHEGAGIGLALVAELAKLHGGTAEVDSTEGVGSTFTVRLPYVPAPAGAAAPAAHRPAGAAGAYVAESLQWSTPDAVPVRLDDSAADPADGSVLVVEDNADLRSFITGLLAPHWQVLVAGDGRTALELARTRRPDLVLSDIMMPHLDGIGLLSALRSDPLTAAIPVVLLSARAGVQSAVGGLDAGADDYLPKPFSSAELVARVRANLELSRLRNRESEFRRALVDSLQEGFFVIDSDGTLLEANHAFFAIVGYQPDGGPYRWPQPWIPAPGTDRWNQHQDVYRDFLRTGAGSFTVPVRHRDGRTVWVACAAATVTDPRSGHQLFVGTLRDVTAERLAAQRDAISTRFAAILSTRRSVRDLLGAAAEHLAAIFRAGRVVAGYWTPDTDPVLACWSEDPDAQSPDALAEPLHRARHHTAVAGDAESTDRGTFVLSAPLDAAGAAAVVVEIPADAERRGDEQELFDRLTSQLSQALGTAREVEQTRGVALTLQHAILGPTHLPHGFAVRYTPAVAPLEVGGDWYDVIALDRGRIGVVVGDCVGRGLPAAAVMGQLRSAAQALLLRTPDPADALAGLDDFARRTAAAVCTTVFCAVIDTATSTVHYSSAGHPPPIEVAPGRPVQRLDGAQSVPLAVDGASRERPVARARLRPGGTLLLYTDGLIERRRESLAVGLDRAAGSLDRHRELHPDALADLLMTELAPASGFDDDVAVLVYRTPPEALTVSMPARASGLSWLRRRLRGWLPLAAVDPESAEEAVLAVGEAASNAVEHATVGATHPVTVQVTASCSGGVLKLAVGDDGRWQPPDRRPGRGHGLKVMQAMMDDIAVDTGGAGTVVRMKRELLT